MGLLKYFGKVEVLKVDGKRTEKVRDSFGEDLLYPEGTQRLVKKYFLFTREIEGRLVRGYWTIKQNCEVKFDTDGPTYLYYNQWKDVEALHSANNN
jgi:hypothetical protein